MLDASCSWKVRSRRDGAKGTGTASGGRLGDLPEAKLDAAGRAVFTLDLATVLAARGAGVPARPWRLAATAGVLEAGGRGVSTARNAVVDPVPAYLLAKPATGCTVKARPFSFCASVR